MSNDFIVKYIPLYFLWLFFIGLVAVSLQISTAGFSVDIPSGSDFNLNFVQNILGIFWKMITFQVSGIPAILITVCFYAPMFPIIIWFIDVVIKVVRG